MSENIKNIVIAGGGTAGWMAAAMLGKTIGKNVGITLVESDAIPTVGVGEATIPPLMTFHKILDINENDFISRVDGTFKLGISFESWKSKDHKYIHSFGYAGKDCWACSFIHFWLAGKSRGIDYPYSDYCAELLAAYDEKFAVLPNGRMNYAYHLDAGKYAKFLREIAEKCGVKRVEGKIIDVAVAANGGNIESLALDGGEVIKGDFFIDCTGFRSLLLGEALHVGFDDWTHWLPCDRAIALQTESVAEPLPYTRSIAHDAGWQWRIPLQSRVGNGLVYSSRYLSDDDAKNLLLQNVEGDAINEPRLIRFRTGTRRQHWHKNCLGLGLASGFLEPLESTSIHLIQKSLVRFMQLFPSDGVQQSDVEEFNRQTKVDVERIRDFIILHYKVTEREDSAFWRFCKNMDIPDTLRQKIDLFSDSAKVFKIDNELFGEESWMQVMMGQGIMPKAHHPVADVMSDQELTDFLAMIRKNMRQMVDRLPSHRKYIDHYCKHKDDMASMA